MIHVLLSFLGFFIGGLIGAAFGALQNAASLRHEARESAGALKSGWMIIPGSIRRVAFLMIALVLAQIGLPILFDGDLQWIVSAGIVTGYGILFYQQIRRRIRSSKSSTLYI